MNKDRSTALTWLIWIVTGWPLIFWWSWTPFPPTWLRFAVAALLGWYTMGMASALARWFYQMKGKPKPVVRYKCLRLYWYNPCVYLMLLLAIPASLLFDGWKQTKKDVKSLFRDYDWT